MIGSEIKTFNYHAAFGTYLLAATDTPGATANIAGKQAGNLILNDTSASPFYARDVLIRRLYGDVRIWSGSAGGYAPVSTPPFLALGLRRGRFYQAAVPLTFWQNEGPAALADIDTAFFVYEENNGLWRFRIRRDSEGEVGRLGYQDRLVLSWMIANLDPLATVYGVELNLHFDYEEVARQ